MQQLSGLTHEPSQPQQGDKHTAVTACLEKIALQGSYCGSLSGRAEIGVYCCLLPGPKARRMTARCTTRMSAGAGEPISTLHRTHQKVRSLKRITCDSVELGYKGGRQVERS